MPRAEKEYSRVLGGRGGKYLSRETITKESGETEEHLYTPETTPEWSAPPSPPPTPEPPTEEPEWRQVGAAGTGTIQAPPPKKPIEITGKLSPELETKMIWPMGAPPAVLESLYVGQPPQDYDAVRTLEKWRDAQQQSMMRHYVTEYKKEPHPPPEELIDIGKHLEAQYEHRKETGQLEPTITIPEDVWKKLTTMGLAEKTTTPEGIVYTTRPGLTYAQLLEAYGAAGVAAPQTVKSLSDYNTRVRQYLEDVQRRQTYLSFREQIKEDPIMVAMRAAIFPVTVGVGVGVGFVKGATFGFVGREIPGGVEMAFGAGEIIVRGAGRGSVHPELFTTRERIEQFASTPELSLGVTIGETLAFWGWGRVFGKVGGTVAARAGPKAKEILTIGEVTAPRATQMFRTFGKVVTTPARWIGSAGHRIYTKAVGSFERVTGKTVWTKARAPELFKSYKVEADPLGMRKAWVDVYAPGKVERVPYLEMAQQPKLALDYRYFTGPEFYQSEAVARVLGKKFGVEMGIIRATPGKQIAQAWQPTLGKIWGKEVIYPQFGITKSLELSKMLLYTPKELTVVPYPYQFQQNVMAATGFSTPIPKGVGDIFATRYFGEQLGVKYLSTGWARTIPKQYDVIIPKMTTEAGLFYYPQGLPSVSYAYPTAPTVHPSPDWLGRMALGADKAFASTVPPTKFTTAASLPRTTTGVPRYFGDVGVEFVPTSQLTELTPLVGGLGGGKFYFPLERGGVAVSDIFETGGRVFAAAAGAGVPRGEFKVTTVGEPEEQLYKRVGDVERVMQRGREESAFRQSGGVGVGIGIEAVPTTAPAQAVRMAQQAASKTLTKTTPAVTTTTLPESRPTPFTGLFLPPFRLGGGAAGGGPQGRRIDVWRHRRRFHEMGSPMKVFFGIKGWPRAVAESRWQQRAFARRRTPARGRRTKRGSIKKKKKVFG